MPNGDTAGSSNARIRLKVKDVATLRQLAAGEAGTLGEDYVEGRFDFEGSMRDLMLLASSILEASPIETAKGNWFTSLKRHWVSVKRHSKARDAQQVQFHCHWSHVFSQLWLDPRRVYSRPYSREPDLPLAQAQEAKLHHICRKLRLRAGERFLDIGAGR